MLRPVNLPAFILRPGVKLRVVTRGVALALGGGVESVATGKEETGELAHGGSCI